MSLSQFVSVQPLCICVCNPDSVCRHPRTVGMMVFEETGFKRERKVNVEME